MKDLRILFHNCQFEHFRFIEPIFLLGHKVSVETICPKLSEQCEDLGIKVVGIKESQFTDETIHISFKENNIYPKSFVFSSSYPLKEIPDATTPKNNISLAWYYYEDNNKFIGKTFFTTEKNLDNILNEMAESLIEYIIDLSRFEKVNFHVKEAPQISRSISFKELELDTSIDLWAPLIYLLKSYRRAPAGKLTLIEPYDFYLYKKTLCKAKWVSLEEILNKEDKLIRVGLGDENLTENMEDLLVEGYIDINLKDRTINLVAQDIKYNNIFDHLKNILSSKESYLTQKELLLIEGFNKTQKEFHVPQTIDQLFKEICNAAPDQLAIVSQDRSVTYHELNSLSNKIAYYLLGEKLSLKGERIAIGFSKSIELIASLLGILKTGACYVPIDPAYPAQRITNILEDAGPILLLCDQAFFEQHKTCFLPHIKIVFIENLLLEKNPEQVIPSSSLPNDLAYIIFTSGSTGKPKGVMIEHASVINLSQAEKEVCEITSESKILSIASIGFDAAGWDIYGALLNGATLYLAPEGIQTRVEELSLYLLTNKITQATFTPAILSLLSKQKYPYLHLIIVMGDKCPRKVMDDWSEGRVLINGYGPTEATIGATLGIYDSDVSETCIGKPMNNYEVHILDESYQILPIDFAGELYIGGSGLARGYLNNPELTAEKFIELRLPFKENSTRLYRTGDLAKWTKDGKIEFLGRIDYQIKIRGIRIEASEIESLINKFEAVDKSLVITKGEDVNKKLIGYITLKNKIENVNEFNKSLRNYLKTYLHPAAVPDTFVILESFPLTINGKINRDELPEPERIINEEEDILPRTTEEQKIKEIFSLVLHQPNIGVFQSFFDLGGHSLTATQIAAHINEEFQVTCTTKDVFENPTIASLSSFLKTKKTFLPVFKVEYQKTRKGPLTNAQERLWFLHQLDPKNISYNLPLAIKITGKLDEVMLKKALSILISRHETFRTVFDSDNGIPFQFVGPRSFEIDTIEIEKDSVDKELTNLCQIPFDLESNPPLNIKLFHVNQEEYILFFVKHNIITDAWSEGVILKELFYIYRCLSKQEDFNLPLLEYQILDIAKYIRETQKYGIFADQLQYWKAHLQNYSEYNFPTDFPRPEKPDYKGERYIHKFDQLDWSYLKKFAKTHNVTPFIVLLTALKALVYKYTNSTDIVIGTALAGRNKNIFENVTGFFVNTLPFRTSFNEDSTLEYFLEQVKKTCLDGYANQDIPFEWIIEHADIERSLNKNPLFQIMMVLQNADEDKLPEIDGIKIERINVRTNTAMFDMVWNFKEEPGRLVLELDYSVSLFSQKTIRYLLNNFEQLLCGFIKDPQTLLKNIPFLNREELQTIKKICNGEKVSLAYSTLQEWLINNWGNINKKNTAVSFQEKSISYETLHTQVTSCSSFISENVSGVSKQKRIGIFLNRSEKLVISILSIIQSGNCYVALDPDYPTERLKYMIKDAALDAIITEGKLSNKLSEICTGIFIINIDQLKNETSLRDIQNSFSSPKDLAYILYTSGTTGQPKGVMISQENVVNFCQDMISRLDFTQKDKFLSITTVSFDIFGLELFATILSGAELILCDEETSRNPVSLVNYFNSINPTKMQATPTMWSMIIDHINPEEKFILLCGGEELSQKLLENFFEKKIKVWNLYGPTETTIWSTASFLEENQQAHIGKPISNTQCYILDKNFQYSPIGVFGRLFIGGKGVSLGYNKKEELTEKFFKQINGEILYDTGDLAKWTHEGNLIFGGRSDFQVKIRGNRIELSDIEYHLSQHTQVKEVICHVFREGSEQQLAAYIIPKKEGVSLAIDELREFLKNKVPAAAIPTAFVMISEFPLTHNKKIDRKRLPKPDEILGKMSSSYVAPENEKEFYIQSCWEKILNLKGISVTENFFNLGGHSLHIPQIVSALNSYFEKKLTIRDFILNSTIREVYNFIENNSLQVK